MAVYLGSQQVGFNTTYGSFAYWYGFSRSISAKSTSTVASRTALATITAPAGVSIYAYQTTMSQASIAYVSNSSAHNSRYYLMGFNVNASLARFYQTSMHYVYPYISSISSDASCAASSRMMYTGAMAFALGITDTKIIDSTLMLSYSTVSQSFFTGLIASFTNISAPLLTSIPKEAFYSRRLIESVNFPSCTNIGNDAFARCNNLASVNFPNCISIGSFAFYHCSKLTLANFPNCTSIGGSAFYDCSKLISANFSNCTSIGTYAFYRCFKLTSISFPNCINIHSNAFTSCYNLISLNLIGVSAVPTLSTDVFVSTPIGDYSTSAGQYGSVYVPASLYNDFITAKNWSDISSRIVSV